MSKEQTLTAEEFYNKVWSYDNDDTFEIMEQYAKTKVLEALEREVVNSHLQGQVIGQRQSVNVGFAKQYYETEVKPKYE